MSGALIYSQSDDPIERLVDHVVQSEENAPHERGLRSIQHAYSEALAATKKIDESKELTQLGKFEARKRIIEQASETLVAHDEHVERLAAKVAATRAEATKIPASERDTETLMLEREIRDRLAAEKLDPIKFAPRIFRALRNDDWTFLNAVERGPDAFSLLNDLTRSAIDAARLERSPLRDRLADEELTHSLFRQVTRTTTTELRKLAGNSLFDGRHH